MEGYQYEEKKTDQRAGKPIINSMDAGMTIRSIHEIFIQAEEARKTKTVAVSVSFL